MNGIFDPKRSGLREELILGEIVLDNRSCISYRRPVTWAGDSVISIRNLKRVDDINRGDPRGLPNRVGVGEIDALNLVSRR